MEPTTCGTCQHWYKRPADPLDLGTAPSGECREGPPQLQLVGKGAMYVAYPPTPEQFPACSRHKQRHEDGER